jgi:hypothetical protein
MTSGEIPNNRIRTKTKMVTIVNEPELPIVNMMDLKIGDYGVVLIDNRHSDEIVLRHYCGVVSLTNPKHTWPINRANTIKVHKLEPGTELKIIVE